ncbi:hypothetical protein [Ureaplasma canigenitalium]|uniref:hypothetical protein n=1 Tax=Ureaplasma canigenitalium TaxID=42092 RepID=UPI0004E1DF77|nr:hypothetical protein [Ureaplasma canigenitalium]
MTNIDKKKKYKLFFILGGLSVAALGIVIGVAAAFGKKTSKLESAYTEIKKTENGYDIRFAISRFYRLRSQYMQGELNNLKASIVSEVEDDKGKKTALFQGLKEPVTYTIDFELGHLTLHLPMKFVTEHPDGFPFVTKRRFTLQFDTILNSVVFLITSEQIKEIEQKGNLNYIKTIDNK